MFIVGNGTDNSLQSVNCMFIIILYIIIIYSKSSTQHTWCYEMYTKSLTSHLSEHSIEVCKCKPLIKSQWHD